MTTPQHITADQLEAMAFRTGGTIEMVGTYAYLIQAGVEYFAEIRPERAP